MLFRVTGKAYLEKFCEKTFYTEEDVCVYLKQLLMALVYLHSQSYIHLDLKPENVLLDSATDSIRLIDFGSAQRVRSRVAGNVLVESQYDHSSTEFYAPEVISRGPVGTYTDMWAFGVILYASLR